MTLSSSSPPAFSYAKYLASKESIDARSLNRNVWDDFVSQLRGASQVLQVIELGGGIGTTFKRIASQNLQADLHYTLVDNEQENLDHFTSHVAEWMGEMQYQQEAALAWRNSVGSLVKVTPLLKDVHHLLADKAAKGKWDWMIAQAFLDLFDIEDFLSPLLSLLRPGGLFYFPINFDGITSFLPTMSPELDAHVESIYHDSMDARATQPTLKGHSQSGRLLLSEILRLKHEILSAGASDWIIHPVNGTYIQSDQFFLGQMLHFVESELKKSNEIDNDVADDWLKKRRQQLNSGELIFLAHQIDVLGRVSD